MGELADEYINRMIDGKIPASYGRREPIFKIEPKVKPMSKLKAVKPKQTEPKKPAILIMSEAGVGKTWFALDFPKPYYIDCENGATEGRYQEKLEKSKGLYFGVEQGAQNFDEVIDQVRALRSEDHPYETLVIDSFTKLFNTEWANEAERIKKAGKKDEFGSSKKPAVAKSRELVGLLNSLDMNVIIITHVKPNWENGEQNGVIEDAWEKLRYELDLTLEVKKQGSTRKAFIRKSRLEQFPEATSFELSYPSFSEKWGKFVIEREHKKVELLTPEQLGRIGQLNATLKTTPEEIDKHLSYGDVTRYEDLSQEKAALIVSRLEAKLPK